MDNKKRMFHYIGYAFIILLAYFIQFAPLMAPILNAYPMPLFMTVIVMAMFERDLQAGIIGLVCGILTDINMANGSGLHALIYMFIAVFISLFIETLLQNNTLSLIFISVPTLLINSLIELLTKTSITSGALQLYLNSFLISAVLSFIFIIPYYLIFRAIFGKSLKFEKPQGVIHSKLKKYRVKKKKTVNKKGF